MKRLFKRCAVQNRALLKSRISGYVRRHKIVRAFHYFALLSPKLNFPAESSANADAKCVRHNEAFFVESPQMVTGPSFPRCN